MSDTEEEEIEEVDVRRTDVKTPETEEGIIDPEQRRYFYWSYRLRDHLSFLNNPVVHERLTDWEQDFVRSVGRFRVLSERQLDKLWEIWKRGLRHADQVATEGEDSPDYEEMMAQQKIEDPFAD